MTQINEQPSAPDTPPSDGPRFIVPIDSIDDPRIANYRCLRDREFTRAGGEFIAEAEFIVRRLLASDYPLQSILMSHRHLNDLAPLVPPHVPIYVVPAPMISKIVGFRFHSGVIACGRRKPPQSLADVASKWTTPATVVVLSQIASTENMGALLRISSAFGAAAVILDPQCCDPFYRQSIRVSMGAIFKLSLVESTDIKADLLRLRQQWGVQLAATVLAPDAEPLARAPRPDRFAILLGNEAQGLAPDLVHLCDRRITIPMKLGTDSLNVAVAAGIFLYHFTS